MDAEEKADGSPVTRADRAAEAVLVQGLRALLPGVAIVSEEGDVEAAMAGVGSTYWLVDPLDGTKEFLKGLPEYTVNVALVDAGVPVLGVIYAPAADCLYLAARGHGARRIDPPGDRRLLAAPVAHPRGASALRLTTVFDHTYLYKNGNSVDVQVEADRCPLPREPRVHVGRAIEGRPAAGRGGRGQRVEGLEVAAQGRVHAGAVETRRTPAMTIEGLFVGPAGHATRRPERIDVKGYGAMAGSWASTAGRRTLLRSLLVCACGEIARG